jgi:hypothetical protein
MTILECPIQACQKDGFFYIGLFDFRAVGPIISSYHMTGWPPVANLVKVSKSGWLWVIWGNGNGVYQRGCIIKLGCIVFLFDNWGVKNQSDFL